MKMKINLENVQDTYAKASQNEQIACAEMMRTAFHAQNKGKPTNRQPLRDIDETIRLLKARQQ